MGTVVSRAVGKVNQYITQQYISSQFSVSDKWIECPACCRTFDFPKILPCYHSVCLRCLHVKEETINCPLCKMLHKVPPAGLELLPDNRFLNDLIEHSSARKLMESSRECGVCSGNTAHKSIKSRQGKKPNVFCTNCRRALCSDCEDVHKSIPITRTHVLISVQEYRTSILKESPLTKSSSIMCHRHPNKILKLYCRDCDYPICDTCVDKDHTGPNHTREKVGDARARKEAEINLRIKGATNLKTRLDGIMKDLNEESESLEMKVEEVTAQINSRANSLQAECKQLIKDIKKDESSLFREISLNFGKRGDAISKSKAGLCEGMGKLTKCIDAAEMLQQDGQGAGFLYMVKQVIQEFKETIGKDYSATAIKDFRFVQNDTNVSQSITADTLGRLVIY
ncbi:E3 ubiquitin-protein ligase TRIM45-like [Saccoglossus kowalevskii]|uniref:Protein PML-like n=1 Tax=Saccoglossus kowalevskii TaxID=10224 RepID=A0ABM0MT11_SACKO|nr:PREDICTED: protein PML-like [Saccoglossus kowalevskii]